MNLTERKIEAALSKLLLNFEQTYPRAFSKRPAPEIFWAMLSELEASLYQRLASRPITQLEIEAACRTATNKFNDACKKMRK